MWTKLASVSQTVGTPGVLSYSGFIHGLNTTTPSNQILKTECSELINFDIHDNGTLETTRPFTKYFAGQCASAPVFFDKIPIGGTSYELTIDSSGRLYYKNGVNQTLIGTLESAGRVIAYNGVALLLDGSYIKYLDGVSSIKIAYDTGSHQFNNLDGGDDTGIAVGDGTNDRVAYKFTSQAWDSGYTIPPVTFSAVLQRVLNGYTGTDDEDVVVKIRKVSDDSIIASKTIIAAPVQANLSDTATTYSVTFASSDIAAQMLPGTAYYASIEYDNGDGTNYVSVRCESTTGNAFVYTASWAADTTKDPLMKLTPSRPPKGHFGDVADRRAFIGGDPDNPGYVWYPNLTHLDWSSTGGGGYIGAVDDNKNNYEVGAIVSLYGDLFVFGTKDQPYLCQLTGSSPSDYRLPALFQKVYSLADTVATMGNDIAFASKEGVKTLSGVQEYGDLRTFNAAKQVKDRFDDYWSTATRSCYFPLKDQYWLSMPNHHRVLVFNFNARTQIGNELRIPAAEREICLNELTTSTYRWVSAGSDTYYLQTAAGGDPSFDASPDAITMNSRRITKASSYANLVDHGWWYGDNDTLGYNTVYFKDASGSPSTTGVIIRSILIPTMMASFDGNFFVGGNDGYIYQRNESAYRDMETFQIKPSLGTNTIEFPFGEAEISDIQLIVRGKGGGSFTVYFYKDRARKDYHASKAYAVGVYDDLTVGEAIMDVGDATFLVSPESETLYKQINFNASALRTFLKDWTIAGYPLFLNGLMIRYRILP